MTHRDELHPLGRQVEPLLRKWFRDRAEERDRRLYNALLEFMPKKALDTIVRTRQARLLRFHGLRLHQIIKKGPPAHLYRDGGDRILTLEPLLEDYVIIYLNGVQVGRVNLL